MRVAVIGAGVSGLACAHELEMHGIMPDVFEERPRSGDLYTHCGAHLQLMNRPVKDPLKDLYVEHQISIKPLNLVKKITMHTPKAKGSVYGNLGFFAIKGQARDSFENQILSQINAPVRYNVRADYSRLAREYDYIIVATGHNDIAKILGIWQDVFKTWLMGATVLGSFDPTAMKMWLNTEYAGSGYAYLTPFNHKSASLILVVPNANRETIGNHWKKFWQIEKLSYKVTALWDLEHVSGFVYPHQVDNILFVGNAGGFMEPFLGFGLVAGVMSGIFAAKSIIEGRNYEEYLEQLKENARISTYLRKALNRFTNKDFDRLVAFLTTPGIRQLIYNTNLDTIKYTALLLGVSEKIISLVPRKVETDSADKY